MGNQLFDASDLRFVNLMQTVFLGSPHIRRLVAAVNQGFQHFFRFGGRLVGHGLPIFFLRHHLCEEGGHFGIFGVGFGQRLRLGKLMRLTRVGDNHGYACSADGFGGGDFETAGTFRHDECDLRPLQNSFPSRQPKPKHRFSAVFSCFQLFSAVFAPNTA
ncbi:PilS protein [Neisseria meningitidis]|nr:PilS protein [Neisseria meningitidis]CWU63341.1 PilS protein [Neisseria meningitidis]